MTSTRKRLVECAAATAFTAVIGGILFLCAWWDTAMRPVCIHSHREMVSRCVEPRDAMMQYCHATAAHEESVCDEWRRP